jgi:hypothetical protein
VCQNLNNCSKLSTSEHFFEITQVEQCCFSTQDKTSIYQKEDEIKLKWAPISCDTLTFLEFSMYFLKVGTPFSTFLYHKSALLNVCDWLYIYIYIPQQWVSVQVFVGVGHPYSQSTEKMLQLIVLCKPGDSSAVVFYAFQGYVYLKKKYWFYQYSLEPVSSKCNCWYTKFWWRCKRSNIVLRGGWIFDQISLMKPIDRFIRATKE